MPKRLTHELTYDAPMADVAEMLADPSFREEVCEFQGVKRAMVSIDSDDNGMEVTIDQVQAAHGIPSFAKKFVGDEINIVQREYWSSPTEGDINVTIPGKPGEMAGTARLSESGGVTTEKVDMTVKVNLPLVGGRIEGLIADLLLKALKAENVVGRDYLSR
jgi:Protein of unknown function (DUF2505)